MAINSLHFETPQAQQLVSRALDVYKLQLQMSIERTQRKLTQLEQAHQISTTELLQNLTAEDLPGGDLSYVEWAGEAKLLQGLKDELETLERVSHQLS